MYLFVYGTLKRGFSNHRVLGNSMYIRDDVIHGFDMYSLGGFPGIVPGGGSVKGELYEIDEERLPFLDSLEGYSTRNPDYSMYLRETIPMSINNEVHQVFVYIWNDDVSRRTKIESGVWE